MIDHFECKNRRECHSNIEKFRRMEADLHNIYPVWSSLLTHRYDLAFAEIEGEDWRFEDCDFEWNASVVEPRTLARGNVARSILYMVTRYDLPISTENLELLKKWHMEDLPSTQEKVRNERIEKIQGQRNPYIDSPTLVDDSRFIKKK